MYIITTDSAFLAYKFFTRNLIPYRLVIILSRVVHSGLQTREAHASFVYILWCPQWPRQRDKLGPRGGGGDSAYERGGDARRKFWIKPLKETDLGVAQAFFDP